VAKKSFIKDKNTISAKSLFNKSLEQKQAIEKELKQKQDMLISKKTIFENENEVIIPNVDVSSIKRVETLKHDIQRSHTRERGLDSPTGYIIKNDLQGIFLNVDF
jgi:hypothetical protein